MYFEKHLSLDFFYYFYAKQNKARNLKNQTFAKAYSYNSLSIVYPLQFKIVLIELYAN